MSSNSSSYPIEGNVGAKNFFLGKKKILFSAGWAFFLFCMMIWHFRLDFFDPNVFLFLIEFIDFLYIIKSESL